MFTEIQPKTTDFALNQKGWFLMIQQKFIKNSSQMQNLGQFGLKNCVCFCMYFLCLSFVCLFVCFYSWPDLNLRLYPHNDNAPNLLASSRKGFTGDGMFGGQGWPLFGPPVIFTPTYLQHA